MEETEWERYGVGVNAKCADCMVHCGFEPTAVNDAVANPLKAAWVALRGPRTEGPMVAEPAVRHVESARTISVVVGGKSDAPDDKRDVA